MYLYLSTNPFSKSMLFDSKRNLTVNRYRCRNEEARGRAKDIGHENGKKENEKMAGSLLKTNHKITN
jgi:hypothetical protein